MNRTDRPGAVRTAAWLWGLLWIGGCMTSKPAEWVEAEVLAASERVLVEISVLALEKLDFPVGSGVDPTNLHAVSGWRNDLHPFRNQGQRTRAELRYERLGPAEGSPAGAQRYRARVRVEREINKDIVRPLDLSYAQWESSPDDTETAKLLLTIVRSFLGTTLQP
jgi:hypothetical protein